MSWRDEWEWREVRSAKKHKMIKIVPARLACLAILAYRAGVL